MKVPIYAAVAASTLLLVSVAQAASSSPEQAYPSKSIRMIIPFPPGGGNDIVARVLAVRMGEQLGQSVVADNRGGAGSIIGTELAAKALPDGYTLLLGGSASMSINPSLRKRLPYDPIRDFTPVSLVGTAPHILVVHPTVMAKTTKDLIDLAKAWSGKLNLASTGIGTPVHLAGELFKSMTKVDMVQVHYKGGGPGYIGLLAGEVNVCFCGLASAKPFLRDGKLHAIAVTSAKRTVTMPEIPTIAESGLPGYEVVGWYSIVLPAGAPKPIVTRLHAEIFKALAADEVKKNFDVQGIDVVGSTPEVLLAYNRKEIEKWAKVIKFAGISPE